MDLRSSSVLVDSAASFLQDENDEEPMFIPSSYNVSIDEDIRPGMLVYRVTARDTDTPPNAMLQYSIVSVAGESALAVCSLTHH